MVAEELDILPTTYFKKLVGSDDIWECRVAAALGKRLQVKIT
jgi:hypothetical protein